MPWPYDGSSSIAERERSRAYQALAQLPELLNEHPAKERERRRYEIAREVLAAIVSNDCARERCLLDARNAGRLLTDEQAGFAVVCADALLAALEAER